jgi:CheY-like chemotaxis protein
MNRSERRVACILVVEDDPVHHKLIVDVIRSSGHTSVSAFTGEEALQILREQGDAVDSLITDIRLPGDIDGWLVGSEFALGRPLRPVVYISGVEGDLQTRRASNSIFLNKPLDVKALVAALQRLADGGDAAPE